MGHQEVAKVTKFKSTKFTILKKLFLSRLSNFVISQQKHKNVMTPFHLLMKEMLMVLRRGPPLLRYRLMILRRGPPYFEKYVDGFYIINL